MQLILSKISNAKSQTWFPTRRRGSFKHLSGLEREATPSQKVLRLSWVKNGIWVGGRGWRVTEEADIASPFDTTGSLPSTPDEASVEEGAHRMP